MAGERGEAPAGSRVAVIGSELRVAGYAMAGALVYPAESREETRAAWASLPADVEVAVLTAEAAGWLTGDLHPGPGVAGGPSVLASRPGVLTVVLP